MSLAAIPWCFIFTPSTTILASSLIPASLDVVVGDVIDQTMPCAATKSERFSAPHISELPHVSHGMSVVFCKNNALVLCIQMPKTLSKCWRSYLGLYLNKAAGFYFLMIKAVYPTASHNV